MHAFVSRATQALERRRLMISTEKRTLKRAVAQTRRLTNAAVKELGAEAAKLRDMAKIEFHDLVGEAQSTGRQRFTELGRELVKLGHRLEKIGRLPHASKPRRTVRASP
jgi:hypothetical protein